MHNIASNHKFCAIFMGGGLIICWVRLAACGFVMMGDIDPSSSSVA